MTDALAVLGSVDTVAALVELLSDPASRGELGRSGSAVFPTTTPGLWSHPGGDTFSASACSNLTPV
jgi:hypothetical protein